MDGSFGARLRHRREEQGIALATIVEQTKIKLSLLEALERDDVSHWPSGIFRRAYIRAYAHAIGLDPDTVVREFLEIHPEPAEVIETLAAASAAMSGRSQAPPTRLRSLVDSAIESLSRRRRGPTVDDDGVAGARSTNASAAPALDLLGVADLCTRLGRVENTGDLKRLLPDAARLLDATGLIVWVWDARVSELRPALVHGYSDRVLAQLPVVRRESDNATAAAFRTGRTCAINGTDEISGALVVPLMTPAGCAGVLAVELQRGREQGSSVRAVATILAAMLAQLIADSAAEEDEAHGQEDIARRSV